MSVKIDLNLEIKCDKCGKKAFNHYPITQIGIDVVEELEVLLDLNDFYYENIDCSDEVVLCKDCRED